MRKSLLSLIEFREGNAPATVSADTNCTGVDTKGFESCLACIYYGTDSALDGSNYWQATLEESDDNSTWTAVADADVDDGTTSPQNLFGYVNATTEDDAIYNIAYIGDKRYVRVVLNETGTLSGPLTVFYVLGHPTDGPTANSVQQS